jgi:hypothetical protein
MGFGCGGHIDPAVPKLPGSTIREHSSGERRRGCSDIWMTSGVQKTKEKVIAAGWQYLIYTIILV